MKKIIKILSMLTICLLLISGLVSCGNEITEPTLIGEKLPINIQVKYSINENMSAIEMFETGVKNYNSQKYVAAWTFGEGKAGNEDSPMSTMAIKTLKIKNDNDLFIDNTIVVTGGGMAAIVKAFAEKSTQIAIVNDKVTKRTSKEFGKVDGEYQVTKWNDKEEFAFSDYYPAKTLDNPRVLYTYKLEKDTVDIEKTTQPVQDGDFYKFTIAFDLEKSVGDFGNVVIENALSKPSEREGATISLKRLYFEVTIWKNGLFRSIGQFDKYAIIAPKGGFVNGQETTNSVLTNFTYMSSEVPIQNYLNQLV